ncbi:hypothetical protein PG997_009283 [Apiospora hydei]|uniref:Uncharacterized protein n=1 Tax=Apiospora hydei TaxID=1337664 RepID=A0ABR1VTN6_9PEZI
MSNLRDPIRKVHFQDIDTCPGQETPTTSRQYSEIALYLILHETSQNGYREGKCDSDSSRAPAPDCVIPLLDTNQRPMVSDSPCRARDFLFPGAGPGSAAKGQDAHHTVRDNSRHILHQRPDHADRRSRSQHTAMAVSRLHPAHGLLLHVAHDARARGGHRQQPSTLGLFAAERLGNTGLSADCVSEDVPILVVGVEELQLTADEYRFSINTLMARKAKGNATLTLTESVIGNAVGPFLSSLLVLGYTSISMWYTEVLPKTDGGLGELLRRVFLQFGLTLILPLAVGQLVQSFFPRVVGKVMHDYQAIRLGSLSLLVLLWSGYDSAFASHAFADVEKTQILGVVVICLSLFVLWMLVTIAASVTFLDREDTIAAVFCIPTKSPALGIPLATILFAGMSAEDTAKVYIPLIIFQFVQTCLSNLATIPLRRWRAKLVYETDSDTASDAVELAECPR